jgi:hypothetical protein
MTHPNAPSRETARWVERELSHSRHVIANAKVVVTFSAALAATFVSATLEPNKVSDWDDWAVRLMLVTLAVTVLVIMLRSGHHRFELNEKAYDRARALALWAYGLMVVQILLSVTSIVAAIGGKRGGL